VARIKEDPNAYWIGMGDYCDGISVYDKHFNEQAVAPRYRDRPRALRALQVADVAVELQPIAGKCLGLIEGNHNAIRAAGQRIVEPQAPQVARQMGLDDEFIDKAVVEDMLVVICNFRRGSADDGGSNGFQLKINAAHGVQAGRKPGASINRIGDIFATHDVHVVFRAHNHQRGGWAFQRIEYVGADFHPFSQKRVGGYTGSFLKAYEVDGFNYAAAGDYPAASLGCWGIRVKPDNREIIAEI